MILGSYTEGRLWRGRAGIRIRESGGEALVSTGERGSGSDGTANMVGAGTIGESAGITT